VLSRYARAGHVITTAYDPYSLLRSAEDMFALKPLARAEGAPSFAKLALPRAF
jgi:hypothetical protein